MKLTLPDQDAEIDPVSTSGGGSHARARLGPLNNIITSFNDQPGNIDWTPIGSAR
jgi:type I restriction enzyme R subunit